MRCETGAAVVVLFLFMFLSLATLFLAQPVVDPRIARDQATRMELQAAKEALLAYAVTYVDNYTSDPAPGYLPCPNLQLPEVNESPDPPCESHRPIIGRLPRRFPMGDGHVFESIPSGTQAREEFWYVLSKGFQNNHQPKVLNTTTPALLTVDGTGGIVALLIAPGAPLAGQQRPSTDPRDYLESENVDGDNDFVARAVGMNDQLAAITRAEYNTRLTERVAADLKRLLDPVFDATGAYPAELPASKPKWYTDNWSGVTNYLSSGATATLRFDGCAITYGLSRKANAPGKNKASCG